MIHNINIFRRATLALAAALLTTATAWAWSGEGTESSPYKISNADDFTKFSNIVNGTNGETRNTSAWGTLTANIDMTGISCSPIGDNDNPYAGTFDGAGHTVEGIILNGNSRIGLFGVVANGGTVQGITLTNSNISGRNPVGGIAGMNWGTITNCHVTNTVSITGTYFSAAVGGIAGMNGYSTGGHNGRVYGCTSAAVIQGTGNSSCVGGIVGNCNASTITDCIAIGAIVNSPRTKGAIVGNMVSSTLSNNYYNGCKVNSSEFTASGVGIGSESNSSQKDAAGRVEPVFCIAAGNDVIMTSSGAATTDYGTNGIKVYSNYLYYNGAFYAKSSASVAMTLGHEEREGYIYSNTYSASDGTFSGSGSAYTLTMPDEDVIVSIARYDLHSFGYTDTYHPDGTTNPYVISDVDGWNLFCDCLNDNDTWNRFSGKTVKLDADITVSRMAGSGDNPFCGNFDGGGNTLTFTATAADNYCAPFARVKGGTTAETATTISNLNVVTTITANDYRHTAGLIALQWGHVNVTDCNATVNISSTVGTINPHDLYPAALVSQASSSNGGTLAVTGCTATGTISTNGKYAAGLVGIVQGTATITDCLVSVTINSSTSGDGTHGGIVAALSGVTNIYGTVFNGRLLGTTTESVGGFIGWRNKGANIYNSLFIPAEVTVKNDNSATFARNDVDTHNCYYTYYLCDGVHYVPYYATDGITRRNGHAPRTVAPAADVTIDAVALTGTATQYNVSGITAYSGGGLQRGETLYYGSGDQLSLTLSNTATGAPLGYQYGYTASAGTLSGTTLTMPDQDVTISVNTADLAPIDWATVNQGNSKDPYMIYNKDQLLLLAHRVNGTNGETANDYQGKYFKLGADITFSPDADETDDYAENYEAIGCYIGGTYRYFKGYFDGDGYTVSGIRIRKTGIDDADSYQGLFGMTGSGANIHDVHLTDARITGYYQVGGIVGYNNAGYIMRCSVTDSYITATRNRYYGTICGIATYTYRLSNNYYHGCTVNGTAVTSGMGCYEADIAANHGALPAYAIALGANITTPPGTFAGQTEWLDTPPVDARLAPENGFTLAGNHYFASGYKFTPGSTLASGAAQGYTPRATLGGQLLNPYTPTVDPDPLAGTAIAQFNVTADCDGKTLASTQAIYSTGQPVTVAYINADGNAGEASAIALDGTETSLAAGTYFAGLENVNFDHTVNLTGNVTLILCDGCTMNVGTDESRISGHGIRRDGGEQSLTIYSQSLGDDMGALSVYTDNGNKGILAYAVTINGGNVTIDSNGDWAIGIYAGNDAITINNGTVSATATGNNTWGLYAKNNVAINGGTVEATGTADGIRIDNGTIAISGGTVNASGSYGINANYGDGTITLGWSKPTDRISINASSYSGTVKVADGKKLHNGSGFLGGTLSDPAAALNGKTLRPAATATYTTADGTAATADAILLDASDNSLPAGNYLATGTLNYTHGITLNGNVTLILADNCHMNVGTSGERIEDRGIYGFSPLTITSEANGTGNGALSIYTTGFNKYGICATALTINGGNITADTNGANAKALNAMSTDLTINGGTLSATATGTDAHALLAYGNFNYNGGNVTATAPNGNAIYATGGNYAFSWRTPADRITIGATGLYAPAGKSATFARLFTDGTKSYTGTLAASVLSGLAAETTLQPCLALADAADNTAAIADHAGQTLAVALTGRTLYKDGSWNTLCLPFSVTTASGTLSGDNVKAMTLNTTTSTFADGTLTLNFTAADETIPAGTPFIIKWDQPANYEPYTGQNAATCSDLVSPVFQGVTINAEKHDATVTDVLTFTGTYTPKEIDADGDNTVLYLGAANKLYYPSKSMTIGTHRAYFQLLGTLTAGEPVSSSNANLIRAFALNFGDDEATGIISVHDSGFTVNASDAWYTLDGRRLDGQPTQRGIYINNGRKVVVK